MNSFMYLFICIFLTVNTFNAQTPDANQGLRADWIRGAWGLNWKPENFYNGEIEGILIDAYLDGINDLRTLDYVQIHLTESNIYSPSHSAPHQLLESFWQGNQDSNGNPTNLIVPRETVDDPFLTWLKAIKAKGLKTMVYVNSYNLLARDESNIPNGFPNISERWMNWCDTNTEAQAFINSKSYYTDDAHERRAYIFCYAEFILKEYAIRYGDLIDAWSFDAADNVMEEECGDNPKSVDLEDQRIYQAFAAACHAGNPNAAISFNNSVGTYAEPYTTPTFFDDFTFGHPFGGAGNMVETESLYNRNFYLCELLQETNGLPFATTDDRDWNDNVVGRFFPKWSTTAWNAGSTPALTDTQFVEWTSTAIIDAGSITWGTALIRNNLLNDPILTIQPLALEQYTLADNYLKENQYADVPNWSRQHTILPPAYKNIPYKHLLKEGFDFWDPENDEIISLIASGSFPSWLNITETENGVWELSGTPTETTDTTYNFDLTVSDASGSSLRSVELAIFENPTPIIIDVNIQATENTTYNSGTITMTGIGAIPNYDTTFEINITVTPNGNFTTYPNAVIVSGISDNVGNSTSKSWGISNDGTNESTNDRIFNGENQFSATIGNATLGTITGSNGITSENISINTFKCITIVNAHSVGDRFTFSADNSADFELGRFNNEVKKNVDLTSEATDNEIRNFTIKNGSTATNDKWAVDNITVQVTVNFSTSTLSIIDIKNQQEEFKIYPNPAKDNIYFNEFIKFAEVTDITGKRIKSYNIETKTINISAIEKGFYLIQVQTNQGKKYSKKLIKL